MNKLIRGSQNVFQSIKMMKIVPCQTKLYNLDLREYWKHYQSFFEISDTPKSFDWYGNQSLEEVFPCIFNSLLIYIIWPFL